MSWCYKNQFVCPIGTFIASQVQRRKNVVNKMTTNNIHGDKYYGICAECLTLNFDSQGFVATLAGISGSYRGIAWELTSHCGCG